MHTSPASCKLKSHAGGFGLAVRIGLAFRHQTPAAPPLGAEVWIFSCLFPTKKFLHLLTMTLGMDLCTLLLIKSIPSGCDAAGFHSQFYSRKAMFLTN